MPLASWIRWGGFVIGCYLIFVTWRSVINTIVLPRQINSLITYRSWLTVRKAYMVLVDRLPRYEQKDRLLAYLGPIALLWVLATWLALFFIGFALLFWPLVDGDIGKALTLSGSSMFTLGVASAAQTGPTVVEFLAAATGLVVVALQIGYLPSIYSAYNRRETLVTALNSRAGAPAWGPEILVRHHLDQALTTLPTLYALWEAWAADITESHMSYPWLMVFRSPTPYQSWITSIVAVLDSAALYLAFCPESAPAEARQFLRMGYVGLRTLARSQGYQVEEDPRPDDPIDLPYAAFAHGVEQLRLVGFPLERSEEEAWPHFHGWRVNYEAAAFALAEEVVAVPAPWTGKREHLTRDQAIDVLANRPRHRSPDDPEGTKLFGTLPFAQRGTSLRE